MCDAPILIKLYCLLDDERLEVERMTERNEMIEAALDSYPDGVALRAMDGSLAYWNRAAEMITGFAAADILGRPIQDALEDLLELRIDQGECCHDGHPHGGRSCLVHVHHKHGYPFSALVRTFALRNSLGEHIGTGYHFHASEGLENLPHGETGEDESIEASQAELEERMHAAFRESEQSGRAVGLLWITIDQAESLRRTHGVSACDAMLKKVHRVLVSGLNLTEEIGRWGENEFLILSRERFAASLASHAQMLAGLARTTDFRWWGDRISITVSIGAAQACSDETLAETLERAKSAMKSCIRGGGNRVTLAPGSVTCSPS